VMLLLTNAARAIAGYPASEVSSAVHRLAHELVSLAGDMRAQADAIAWTIDEFSRTVDRLPQTFDREEAKAAGAAVLRRIGVGAVRERRDLFLIYVPEDRLPHAAPLAVELTKRRVSVAFAEYEVASAVQLDAAIEGGLALHRGGLVLRSRSFDRTGWRVPGATPRLRVIEERELARAAETLSAWVQMLRVSNF
jgi:hypothetical protein